MLTKGAGKIPLYSFCDLCTIGSKHSSVQLALSTSCLPGKSILVWQAGFQNCVPVGKRSLSQELHCTWTQPFWPECRERNPYLWNLEKEVSRTNRVTLHQETSQYSNEKQARSRPLFLIPSFRKPGYLFSTWLTPVRHLIGGKSRIVPPVQSPSTSDQVYDLYHVCTVISLAI